MNLVRWTDRFRACLHCGSMGGPIDLYCEYCWTKLIHPFRTTGTAQEIEGGKLFSLFSWSQSAVGRLLHALKGESHSSAFERLAGWFAFERSRFGKVGPLVLVPAPPKRPFTFDHAHFWATALAAHWDAPVWAGLKRTSTDEQKKQGIRERNQKRLEVLTNLNGAEWAGRKVIFCDDVYTTGATARAAHRALGEPTDFEVWTVACRPRIFQV
ncbi:MAG: hypothetical protein ABL958_20915 [Bdellovibrionia bacterium]